MPGNILTGVVRITAPGVDETFKKIGASVTATEGKLKQLNTPISKLGDTLETLKAKAGARRSFLNVEQDVGKIAILNKEIGALDAEILRIGNIGKTGFDQFGVAIQKTVSPIQSAGVGATKFLSVLRNVAYVLPGIGLAGLIGGLVDLVAGLFSASNAFSDAAIKASLFKDSLDDIKSAQESLKGFLEIQNKLKSLDFKIKNGPGVAADINDLNNELEANNTIIARSEANINKLDKRFQQLSNGIENFRAEAKLIKQLDLTKLTAAQQLLASGKDVAKITPEELKKLSSAQRAIVTEYQETSKTLVSLQKDRQDALDRNKAIPKETRIKDIEEEKRVLNLSKGEYEKYVNETIASASKLAAAFKNTIDLKLDTGVLDTKAQTFQKSLDFLNKFKANKFKVVVDPELKLSEQEVKDQQALIEQELANLEFDVKGIKTKPIPIEPQFSIETGFVKQEIEKKFKEFGEQISNVTYKLNVVTGLETTIDSFDLKSAEDAFSKLFATEKQFQISATPVLRLTPGALANAQALAAIKTDAEKLADTFSQTLTEGFTDSFAAIGEGIGNLLSGADFGSQFAQVFGSLFSTIGKALIKFGIVKEGIDKILGPGGIAIPGALAIGLGIFAIAAGALLKGISGAREKGGRVMPDGSYLVGEKGPELFKPDRAGVIIPNGRTRGILAASTNINTGQGIQTNQNYTGRGVTQGGITVSGIIKNVLQGQDLLQIITLATQSQRRLT